MEKKSLRSPWAEAVSKLPSSTRRGEAQTAEQLFRMFGMNIPYAGNIDDDYEFDVSRDSVDKMFETSRNDVVDHHDILDVMEQEFIKHSNGENEVEPEFSPAVTSSAVQTSQPEPSSSAPEKEALPQ